MWPNPQETTDLVTFTKEIPNGKPHFLCSDSGMKWVKNIEIIYSIFIPFSKEFIEENRRHIQNLVKHLR